MPEESRTVTRFSLTPLSGALGAEVSGLRLADPLDPATKAELHRAWLDYKVLFFHDQVMTPEQHQSFAAHWGTLTKESFMPALPGAPHVMVQQYPQLFAREVADICWHTDATFLPMPPKGSVLYALDVPAQGGDTTWVCLAAAYDDLSDHWRRFLSGLTAIHDNVHRNLARVIEKTGAERFAAMRKVLPPQEHPVVRTHPETGRQCLFVSELMTSHIVGMSREESDAVLRFLFAHCTKPEFAVRFKWRKHAVAFWDNRCLLHKGIFDFGMAPRLMHRVSIDGDDEPH
jgi:taurine dioxygenase